MKRRTIIVLCLLGSCAPSKHPLSLGDYFDIDSIYKVRMHNYSGNFYLNENQLRKFKGELGKATPISNALKLGAIGFLIYYKNDSSMIYSNSNSSFLECPSDMFSSSEYPIETQNAALYFSTSGVNYQNYNPLK